MSDLSPSPAALDLYAQLHQHAAVLSLGNCTHVILAGADRVGLLNAFCTADIKKLQPSQGAEAFVTNHQGKAAGHLLILAEDDQLLLHGAPGQGETVIQHLDRFVISERVEFKNQSEATTDLLLAGPAADSVVNQLKFAQPQPERLSHKRYALEGRGDLLLTRVDFFGTTPAYLITVPAEFADQVQAEIAACGASTANNETCAAVWNMARIEAGYPLFGQDITDDNLPQEVCRTEQAINFKKGCYLGQETIARLDALGHVNRVLTGLKLPAGSDMKPGDTIQLGEKKIAQITSLAWSPKLQQPLALAYVRTLHATSGKKLAVTGGEAEIVKLPLE
ncbi:CAF17-like 4Fe-4S cluster assembly/insertion protein YgfZ [Anatilimnocola floriformis]|uniref:CAF17-like 4Fe-4S cluster assembly/insertion protein YgfZ n=1 Tax=Anatilimnocola floriformis TaxID=2948575 RepID=UPI0020C39967|nr:glycine cleavage T C-terminal barrel domain-containing protein [Anatilimnocola floriformis]